MKSRNLAIIFCVAVACLLTLSGCKVTGGGWLASASEGKANFGFVLQDCDEAKGQFTYIDMAAGVKVKGELISFIGDHLASVSYRSTNPQDPGEGIAEVYFADTGEGNDDHGFLQIAVLTGPFQGYFNAGLIDGGNIQEHECPAED